MLLSGIVPGSHRNQACAGHLRRRACYARAAGTRSCMRVRAPRPVAICRTSAPGVPAREVVATHHAFARTRELSLLKARKTMRHTLYPTILGGLLTAAFLMVSCGGSGQAGFAPGVGGGGGGYCSSNGACSPPTPYCGPGSRCVECVGDANCAGKGARYCLAATGTCVDCLNNANCGGGMVCDQGTHRCVRPCSSNADCGGGQPYCNAQRGVCVQCLGDANCAGTGRPYCLAATGQCVECLSDANCGGGDPYCYAGQHVCVECLTNAQCPGTDTCQPDHCCGGC